MSGRTGVPEGVRPDWPVPPGVQALTTLRGCGGVSQGAYASLNLGLRSGDDPEAVRTNRRALFEGLHLPAWPHWLQQVHGQRVQRFGGPSGGGPEGEERVPPEADAAVTAARGAVLAILTADCLPVLFSARDGSEVAAAHAGWRGLQGGVLEATLAAMHAPAVAVQAWIGPGIGATSYEVDGRVRDAFVDADAGADAAFAPTRPGHWQCDLPALARLRLRRAGVTAVYGGDFDTFSDARFYSYRRDGADSGRMVTLIWRR